MQDRSWAKQVKAWAAESSVTLLPSSPPSILLPGEASGTKEVNNEPRRGSGVSACVLYFFYGSSWCERKRSGR